MLRGKYNIYMYKITLLSLNLGPCSMVFDRIAYIQSVCLPDDDPVTYQENSEGYWYVVHGPSSKIVAFALMVQSQQWIDAVYMSRCCVLPQHRGKALQKRLLYARERLARSKNYNWSITDTCENPASGNSLIKCGYRLFTPSNPWGLKNSIYWSKNLNAVQRSRVTKKKK